MLQRSVYITVRQADFFFVRVLRGEQIRVPSHPTGDAVHLSLSIHGTLVLVLVLVFSISYVMCGVVEWSGVECGVVWYGVVVGMLLDV